MVEPLHPRTAHAGGDRRIDWSKLIPWCLMLAGVAVYHNSFLGIFVFDDDHAILRNTRIRQLWPLTDLLTSTRPFVEFTFALNYAVDGYEERGYHLVNMAIHIAAGLVLYALIWRTLRLPAMRDRAGPWARWFAAAVAMIFIVHPLQTQAVTYIVQRAESLAALFYMLVMYCFIRSVEPEVDRRSARAWLWGAVASCLLGMQTKPTVITAPALILLYDYVFVSGSFVVAMRRRMLFYAAMVATWPLVWVQGVGQALTTKGASVGFETGMFTWQQYAMSQPQVILHYLRLAVWPHPLCLDYIWLPPTTTLSIIVPAVIVAGLVMASTWLVWRRSWVGFVGAWFFVILSPTSTVVPITDMAVEHRMYLPLAAVIVLGVAGFSGAWRWCIERFAVDRRVAVVVAVVVLGSITVPLGMATVHRNEQYSNGIKLWLSVIEVNPSNARAHHNLGSCYYNQGYTDKALVSYETAISMAPDYADAYNNLGKVCLDLGRTEDALADFLKAVRIKPDDATFHYNVGRALMTQGKTEEAEQKFYDALRIDPELATAHSNLGIILLQRGQPAQAMERFKHAIELDPDLVYALFNIGKIMLDAGAREQALPFLVRAASVDEDDPDVRKRVLNTLGVALAQVGRREEAVDRLLDAVVVDPDYADAHTNLATVFMEGGRVDLAVRAYNEALRIEPDNPGLMRRLAWVYATSPDPAQRNGADAVRLAEGALKAMAKPDPPTLTTLAAAYAQAGRFEDAIATASEARAAAQEAGYDGLVKDIGGHIERYRARKTIGGGDNR